MSDDAKDFEEKIKKLCNMWNVMNNTLKPKESLFKLLSKTTEFPNKYEVIMKTTNNFTNFIKADSIINTLNTLKSGTSSIDMKLLEKIIATSIEINKIDTSLYLHRLPQMNFEIGLRITVEDFHDYIKIIKCIFNSVVDVHLQDIKDIECKQFTKRQINQLYSHSHLLNNFNDYLNVLKCLHQNKSIKIFTENDGYELGIWILIPKGHKIKTEQRITIKRKVCGFYWILKNGFISNDIFPNPSEKTYIKYFRLQDYFCEKNPTQKHKLCFATIIEILDQFYKLEGEFDYNNHISNNEIFRLILSSDMPFELPNIYNIKYYDFEKEYENSPGFLFIKSLIKQYLSKQALDEEDSLNISYNKYTYEFLQNLVYPKPKPNVEVLQPMVDQDPKPKSFREIIKKMFYKKRH
jgi:hypothetical protein